MNWRIYDGWRRKPSKRRAARLVDSRWLVLEKRLIGGYFSRLGGPIHSSKSLQALPADPAKLMVVPHAHERPTCSRILQVRIVQIIPVDGTVIPNVGRNVNVIHLLAVFVADNVAQTTAIHALRSVFRVPDEFVDKVSQVEHEPPPIVLRGVL